MDQIKSNGVATVDIADVTNAEAIAQDVKALEEWQMVMVGGGEGVPCWG